MIARAAAGTMRLAQASVAIVDCMRFTMFSLCEFVAPASQSLLVMTHAWPAQSAGSIGTVRG